MKLTAERFDEWRVFPRIFSGLYGFLLYLVVDWYMVLPSPTMEQSAFASAIIAGAAAWFKFYVESGKR